MAYSTIPKPSVHFNTKLYTGNGTAIGSGGNAITGVGFQPDWTWIKRRDGGTSHHQLFDAVRGATKRVYSSSNSAESTDSETLTAFGTDGFTVGSNTGVNPNGNNLVAWNWKAGTGQGSSNTDGSINTTYTSVNTTAGFSISSYTGTGSNATVGHGLGVAPSFVIIKDRDNAISWVVSGDNIGWNKNMYLNDTSAIQTANHFQDTAPTSSLMYLSTDAAVNGSSRNYIMYCFAEKTGYSKFGSYTGNGSTDGTFVYTGFKPAFVLQKRTDSGSTGWGIFDSTRSPSNEMKNMLLANSNAVEDTSNAARIDFLSSGFKFRTTDSWFNGSGNPNIYMAFAEEPLVANSGSNGVPATAR